MTGGVELLLGEARVVLLPHRAAWLPEHAVLLIADTHFGKCDALRAGGACIPAGVNAEMLGRLDRALDLTGATRVVVVGDLLHAPIGVTPRLVRELAEWIARRRSAGPFAFDLVPGNHDARLGAVRLAALAAETGLGILPGETVVGGLHLRHFPEVPGPTPAVCGHAHPAIRVPGGGLRGGKAPVFHVTPGETLVLPAFSVFTSGSAVCLGTPGDHVFAIAEDRVIALGTPTAGVVSRSSPGGSPRQSRPGRSATTGP